MSDPTSTPSDDALIERLARALAEGDPVPDAVHRGAIDAFAFRDLESALAELVVDAFATVRSIDDGPMVFATGDVEIAVSRSRGTATGQLTPPGPWAGRVESPRAGPVSFRADGLGRFRVTVPPGPVRLVVALPGGAVRTDWFSA